MLTEIQTIILTCLLGPEDTGAFKRERRREAQHRYHEANRDRRNAESRAYRAEHPEYFKKYHADHADEAREYDRVWKNNFYWENREARLAAAKVRRQSHPGEGRETKRKNAALRRKSDPAYRLKINLRRRVFGALKRAIAKKGAKTFHLIGCSSSELMVLLESKFKPGMTWENYGPVWHVDHIKPCASFNLLDPEQQRICFHWTNLQPLFATENLKKGDKYVG